MFGNRRFFLFAFLVAVLLRLLFVPNPGFEADVSFWKSWGLATADFGIVEGMKATNNNYPTPFAYTLGLMVKVYSLFADPHTFNEFWQNTNLAFLAVSKAFPILADLGIAALILFIGRNASSLGFPQLPITRYQLLAFVYLLSPIGLLDGALWGQVDSLGVFTFLLALLALLKRRPFLAGVLYMIAMMTKLQNMIYGPLFFLFVWQTTGLTGLTRAAAGACAGFFGLNIEFFLARNMDRVITSLTENFDYFPYLSLNAFNLWWIVAKGHGMQIIDKVAAVGIVNAKTVGLIIFSSFYLFAVFRQMIRAGAKKAIASGAPLATFLENLIIVNAAFFLFQTQSHDRYAFPLSVFLLLWAPFFMASRTNELTKLRSRLFFVLYVVFTVLYFYNLHTALVFNYPDNGLPLLSHLTQPWVTIAASVLLIGLFFLFLFVVSRAQLSTILIPALSIAVLLFGANYKLITKHPISLTKITPFLNQQDYGGRQTNRSVGSSFGIKSWTRLSVQYAFYKTGIGTHANSHHIYDINRKFKTFTTDFGIDTEAGLAASAVFEVYGDNRLLFRSEKMGRFDLPRHLEVDVTGVTHLAPVTGDAADGNTDDHTDWLRPTLWP